MVRRLGVYAILITIGRCVRNGCECAFGVRGGRHDGWWSDIGIDTLSIILSHLLCFG